MQIEKDINNERLKLEIRHIIENDPNLILGNCFEETYNNIIEFSNNYKISKREFDSIHVDKRYERFEKKETLFEIQEDSMDDIGRNTSIKIFFQNMDSKHKKIEDFKFTELMNYDIENIIDIICNINDEIHYEKVSNLLKNEYNFPDPSSEFGKFILIFFFLMKKLDKADINDLFLEYINIDSVKEIYYLLADSEYSCELTRKFIDNRNILKKNLYNNPTNSIYYIREYLFDINFCIKTYLNLLSRNNTFKKEYFNKHHNQYIKYTNFLESKLDYCISKRK